MEREWYIHSSPKPAEPLGAEGRLTAGMFVCVGEGEGREGGGLLWMLKAAELDCS